MKKIFCVRHGRTAWNALGRFQGIADIPLDDIGREQVRESSARLRNHAFSYAVSSDLTRACETMQVILAGRALQPEASAAWRERNFGAWEGLTWAEITEQHPELSASIAIDVRNFEPPGGEGFDDVKARVAHAFRLVRERLEEEQSALIVAHAGVMHALLDTLLGPERTATMIAPAGILEFHIDGDHVTLVQAL